MSFLKVSSLAIAATLFAGSAFAADLIVADPVVDMASPKASEFYAGITGTVGSDGTAFGGVGVVVGADVDLTDVVFIGGELRGAAYWNNGGYLGAEALVAGRLGLHASDAVDLYAVGAVGIFAGANGVNNTIYLVGAGADFDVADGMAIRTEIAGTGVVGAGIDSVQGTLGLLWKL